jgi:hypothetical protein
MENTQRRHITLPTSTLEYLEDYQRLKGLPNFSATIEAAVQALKKENLISGYKEFANNYANSKKMQEEAESWLELSMEEQ